MSSPFLSLAKNLLIEWPAAGRSYGQLATTLERSGLKLQARLAGAPDAPANRKQLCHIIGLERWGQRRLRSALGEPPAADEMDDYIPPAIPVPDLVAALAATRTETVVLARQLEARRIPRDATVEHNQFGPLTPRGWLAYLNTHANIEATRVKR
jgi:hypothetical protein